MSSGLTDFVDMPSGGESTDNDDVLVDDTAGGVTLLQANPNRKSALITNVGADPMRVTTDGSDPTATHGKRLIGGASLTLAPPYCPTREVKAIREGANDTTANASEVE